MLCALLCTAAALAQPLPVRVPLSIYMPGSDLYLLSRLATMDLTVDQIKGLLAVYDKFPAVREAMANIRSLERQLRAQLLLGKRPSREAITDLWRAMRDLQKVARDPQTVEPFLTALTEVLQPWQVARLAVQRRFYSRALRGASRAWGDALAGLQAIPEEQWPKEREAILHRIFGQIADSNAEAVDNVRAFLNRVRAMAPAQVEQKADELAEEILALLPEGVDASPELLKPVDPRRARAALLDLFLQPRVPELLSEMLKARQAGQ